MSRADEARALARRADEHSLAGQTAEALPMAREAVALARGSGDEEADAEASTALATALLTDWEQNGPADHFDEALDLLDHAAIIFEPLGTIDFWSVLVILAEINLRCENFETAQQLFARVTHDLGDPCWAAPDTAAEADHLRARAFSGLGFVAIDEAEDAELAFDRFESAVNLFMATGGDDARPHLERIAAAIEDELGDPAAAKLVRDRTRDRLG
jgi:hypothetical protein